VVWFILTIVTLLLLLGGGQYYYQTHLNAIWKARGTPNSQPDAPPTDDRTCEG
jgi:hypothetical protein